MSTYREIESDFSIFILHVSEEAGVLVRAQLVGESGGGDEREKEGDQAGT